MILTNVIDKPRKNIVIRNKISIAVIIIAITYFVTLRIWLAMRSSHEIHNKGSYARGREKQI